ncbi:MAG: hypothetical protein Q9180_007179, partial [Flavoplaca navasiana]
PFHSDPGEVLGLYIVEPASSGGETLVASAGQVYNEIARTKPHLISVLAQNNWPHWTKRSWPLLFPGEDGRPFFGFSRYALTGCTASPRPERLDTLDVLPPLTDLQADALDTVEFIARKYCIALPQRKGDLHFLSNRAHLHARTGYADDFSHNERHLMRVCLTDSEFGHVVPTALKDRAVHFFDYPKEQGKWMLQPEIADSFASSRLFESLFTDESGTHSNGT